MAWTQDNGGRFNLLKYSEQIDNVSNWARIGGPTLTADTVTDPLGGSTADVLTLNNGGSEELIRQLSPNVTALTDYTISFWAKAPSSGGSSDIRVATNNTAAWNTGWGDKFALTTSWQRFSSTGQLSAGTSIYTILGNKLPDNTSENLDGDMHVWGVQTEIGSIVTTYIPTVAVSPLGADRWYETLGSKPPGICYDGTELTEQLTESAQEPGEWWWDAGNSRVYIMNDPTGKTVTFAPCAGASGSVGVGMGLRVGF